MKIMLKISTAHNSHTYQKKKKTNIEQIDGTRNLCTFNYTSKGILCWENFVKEFQLYLSFLAIQTLFVSWGIKLYF